ncbi:hypothetical protein [Plasmodium yoelii yoelii]|uniref:Uncharacterized protein n=1 Tax=Plasmodium yoelii yoelii TaxID=73239 RepID=Q7RR53_PLAYO|nr:hypothetical protein [Plasmodium yoelii yoelii]
MNMVPFNKKSIYFCSCLLILECIYMY